MEQLLSLQNLGSQNIILKELVDIVKKSKESKNCKNIVYYLALNAPFLLLLISFEYFVRNPENLLNFLKSMLLKLFYKIVYRKFKINFDDKDMDGFFIEKCKENSSSLMSYVKDDNGSYIHYVPYLSNYQKIYSDFLVEYQTKKNVIKTKKLDFTRVNNKTAYLQLNDEEIYFPCKNHLKIVDIIQNRLEEIRLIKCYKPVGILIDSVPGLAKTYTIDYIASLNIVEKCYYIKMNSFTNNNFMCIFNDLISPGNLSSVYLIDELDKYLYHYIEKSYLKYLEEMEQESKIIPISFEQFSKNIKDEVITEITEILDSRKNMAPCFIIFCSNNFDTIFEGADLKHVRSLFSRFLRINYEYCDREELKKYLLFYNNFRVNTSRYFEEEQIINSVNNINDFQITYRYLDHISKLCNNNPFEIVNIIQQGSYVSYDIQEEKEEKKIEESRESIRKHYERIVQKITTMDDKDSINIIEKSKIPMNKMTSKKFVDWKNKKIPEIEEDPYDKIVLADDNMSEEEIMTDDEGKIIEKQKINNYDPKYFYDENCFYDIDTYPECLKGFYIKHTFEPVNGLSPKDYFVKNAKEYLSACRTPKLKKSERVVLVLRLLDFIYQYQGSFEVMKNLGKNNFCKLVFDKTKEFVKDPEYGSLFEQKIKPLQHILEELI